MHVQELRSRNFWFMSAVDSSKNQAIEKDPRVQLFISTPGNYEFYQSMVEPAFLRIVTKLKSME